MQHHELKCWPQYFEPVMLGLKTFELRRNDRGFQAGDMVTLLEFKPKLEKTDLFSDTEGKYTGRRLQFKVGYCMPLGDGSHVVLSINDLTIEKQ